MGFTFEADNPVFTATSPKIGSSPDVTNRIIRGSPGCQEILVPLTELPHAELLRVRCERRR